MRVFLVVFLSAFLLSPTARADFAVIPPSHASFPKPTPGLDYGTVYGSVSFRIQKMSVPAQQYWLGQLLGSVFGFSTSGEYILAIELLDQNGKLVARQIIAHFVKSPQGTLITDFLPFLASPSGSNTKVQDASAIVFSGDVSSRLPINADTNNYSVVMQLYKSSSVTLTKSSLIENAIDIINSSTSIIKFSPISAAEKAVYQQLLNFGLNIYQTVATSSTVVASQTKMSFIAKDSPPAPNVVHFVFPYEFDKPTTRGNTIDVVITFNTFPSVLTTNFHNGKFGPPLNWAQWLAQGAVNGQTVPQFLASNDATKSFYTALVGGVAALKKYGNDTPVDRGCDSLITTMTQNQYFSAPDVGALYWSILNEYWSTLTAADQANAPRCQSKYAAIYFDPYGLPQLQSGATPAAASASSVTRTAPSKSGAPSTVHEAMSAAGKNAARLQALQGVSLLPQ